jgi:uncharacterized tellurite resistance protein B-like protein
MGLWSAFKESLNAKKSAEFSSRLHEKIAHHFSERDENFQVKAACLSGMMARIAFADLKIEEAEKESIISALKEGMELTTEEATTLTDLCLEEVKDLAGVENHLYCLPLRESLSEQERYQILITLFKIAAADGNVENLEGEEIRNISKGLLLEHKHFISARSTVLEYLGSLKK